MRRPADVVGRTFHVTLGHSNQGVLETPLPHFFFVTSMYMQHGQSDVMIYVLPLPFLTISSARPIVDGAGRVTMTAGVGPPLSNAGILYEYAFTIDDGPQIVGSLRERAHVPGGGPDQIGEYTITGVPLV